MSIRKYKKSVIFGCAAVAAGARRAAGSGAHLARFVEQRRRDRRPRGDRGPGRPAAGAGLQRGDIIVQVDGAAIENHRDFLAAISDNGVDDTLDLELRRGNESVSLSVTVGENSRGPYLGLLIVPDGAGAFRAETFGDQHDRGRRWFRGRGGDRSSRGRGMGSGWQQEQQNTAAAAGGSA